jgi:hypothetical protein
VSLATKEKTRLTEQPPEPGAAPALSPSGKRWPDDLLQLLGNV